ncbi:MAG: hypothetical protein C0487_14960 [Leptothrix sp. (in: Bacteria)]|nr:hypothetical protein [Leptothrix sp. (in: b-proteobacteria)]
MAVHDVASLNRFLRMAVVAGVESAVQVHIDRGDDLNARDDKGLTPLMLSAARNKAAVCRLLVHGGADAALLDPSGKTALDIARAAGAYEVVAVIEAASSPAELANDGVDLGGFITTLLGERSVEAGNEPSASRLDSDVAQPPNLNHSGSVRDVADVSSPAIEWAFDLDEGGAAFDLTGWEAEDDQPPPESDPTLSAAAFDVQRAISRHQPIDTSIDWDDFDAYLPERASPLPRPEDVDVREQLRLVLLRAIREGSVPDSLIEDLSFDGDGVPSEEAGALLRMVINDLGAETDERFEYASAHENFEVFVSPVENSDEEVAVADTLEFMDDLAARRNEPMRIYQREYQREPLLTGDAEVALGQAMEQGVERALDSLASWPSGIAAVLDSVRMVMSGAKPLRWISVGQRVEPHDIDPNSDEKFGAEPVLLSEDLKEEDEHGAQSDANEFIDESSEFFAQAEQLSVLAVSSSQHSPEWRACRGAIGSLGLTRGFLLELADAGISGEQQPALAFAQAMSSYRRSRDRMTVSNLKLVFSIAKKYLFSGLLLDDLVQEGNIGLIKAVDRYDWRRGFKFSTYATWWIRQQVGRHLADKSKTIRLPVHVYEKVQRIAQAGHAFEMSAGRAPTIDELAARVDMPAHKVAGLNRLAQEPLPIDDEPDVDARIAVGARDEFIARDPMDIVSDLQLINSVDRLLGTLKSKDERILRLRFGIGVPDSMTLEEIGSRLNVTRERIRQLEAAAIRHLKHPGRIDRLRREFSSDPLSKRDHGVVASNEFDDDESDGNPSTVSVGTEVDASSPPEQSKPANAGPGQLQPTRQSALDKLIDQLLVAGIAVEDDRDGGSGRLWVNLTEAPDMRSRRFVRKLIAMGFEFWPGKGYWR